MTRLRHVYRNYLHNFIGICCAMALILNLVIETLARQNILGGLAFFAKSPVVFIFNSLLIFGCLSVAMLFRRKAFAFAIISATWLILGIVNGIILRSRMTPLTTYDMLEVKDGLSLATNYFSKMQIGMLIGGAALLLLTIGIMFKKFPKTPEKVNYKRALAAMLLIACIVSGGSLLVVKAKAVDTYFPNLAYGYRDNGFVYCFLATWLDKGVARPAGYSKKSIEAIFTDKEKSRSVPGRKTAAPANAPNIIFLQMESFVDPRIAKDIKLDKDAIPYYRSLMKNESSGKIQVPSVGAGTANTEFEVMTGMNVKFFGPGEYPYKSVLGDTTCESIPYDLIDMGYSTHAVHNHRGAFYKRNAVFGHLGFQTFTSLEYMSNVGNTPKNWAKDYILTDHILDAMNSTKGKDYVYAISVQGHGKYPTEQLLVDPPIKVIKAPSEGLKWAWEYYVNQLYEMDQFIKDFLEAMKKYPENVVVVIYGDHLPALDNLTQENLVEGRNIYQTDYVIWSNFNIKKKKKDYFAYQIGPELLNRLGIHNGTLVTYHQNHQGDAEYMENLKALQYDMLYGKHYIYGNQGLFKALKLHMGVKEIKINEVVQIGEKYYIKGQNFTPYSKVNLDGKILKTVYLGPTILGLQESVKPSEASKMKISQVEKNNEILSTTE